MTTSILRWTMKKAARVGMALSMGTRGLVSVPNTQATSPAIRVLTYHRFGASQRDPFCVSASVFAKHVAWLATKQLAVSLPDVEAFVRGEKTLPQDAVLISIDDGFRSVAKIALPILRDYGIPAAVYVTTGNVGRDVQSARAHGEHIDEDYLNWDEIIHLHESGIAIGSHAHTHRSMACISLTEATDEAVRSKEQIEKQLSNQVTSFAYPFGTLADFNTSVAEILYKAGYRSAFTSQHGVIQSGLNALTLPRIKIEGGEGPWMFPFIANGGLDQWSWIDRYLWRFQASGAS